MSWCALGGSGVCFGDGVVVFGVDVVVLARQGPCCSIRRCPRRMVPMSSSHSALVSRSLLLSSGDHLWVVSWSRTSRTLNSAWLTSLVNSILVRLSVHVLGSLGMGKAVSEFLILILDLPMM